MKRPLRCYTGLSAGVIIAALCWFYVRNDQRRLAISEHAVTFRFIATWFPTSHSRLLRTYDVESNDTDALWSDVLPSVVMSADRARLLSWRAIPMTRNAHAPPESRPNFHESWNSPRNQRFSPWGRDVFYRAVTPERTFVCAIVGPNTAFDDASHIFADELSANQIILIEVADCGYSWMEPGDIEIEQLVSGSRRPLGVLPEGFFVVFADRQVWFLDHHVPLRVVLKYCTRTGARAHNREDELAQYAKLRIRTNN